MDTFYAYWNAVQIRDLFEAIVFIVGGDDYLGLLRAIAVVGLLVVVTGAIFSLRHVDHFLYLPALAVFYMVLLVPRMDIVVRDMRTGDTYAVSGVPLGVGVFAASSSHIGYWITEMFETAFLPADDWGRFSRFGMAFPQRLIATIQQGGAVTPYGRQLINAFVRDCVVPEMIETPARAQEVMNSSNIWGTISAAGWVNPARLTVTPDGDVLACDAAVPAVGFRIDSVEMAELRERFGRILVPEHSNPSAVIAAQLPQVEAAMLNVSRTMEESLRQSVMLGAIPDGVNAAVLQSTAAQPLAQAVNVAVGQGNLASVINYRAMSEIAKSALPKLRAAVEFLVIAAFPLMLLMVLAAGHRAGLVLKGFFVMLIWVQLWAPFYAVINYLMVTADASPLTQIVAAHGGNSLAVASLLRDAGASMQDIAGMMTLSVPIIAYALAKSTEIATTSMIGAVMAPGQSAAQSAGTALAAGNLNLGNVQWGNINTNNVASNLSDRSFRYTDPTRSDFRTPWGSYTTDGAGNLTGASVNAFSPGAAAAFTLQTSGTSSQESGSASRATTGRSADLTVTSGARVVETLGTGLSARVGEAIRAEYGGETGFANMKSSKSQVSAAEARDVVQQAFQDSAFGVQSRVGVAGSVGMDVGGGYYINSPRAGAGTPPMSFPGAGQPEASPAPYASQKGGFTDTASYRGGLRAGVEAGVTGSAQVTARLVDIASGRVSGMNDRQRAFAAELLSRGFERVASQSSDGRERSMLQGLQRQFEQGSMQAVSRQGVGVESTDSAASTERREQGRRLDSRSDLAPALMAYFVQLFGSVEGALRAYSQNPVGFLQAVNDFNTAVKDQLAGPLNQGLPPVLTQEQVLAQGQAAVDAAAVHNQAAVAAKDGQNVARVNADATRNGIPPPASHVDSTPAAQRFAGAAEQAEKTRSQQDLWTNRAFGAVAAANQYANDSTGIGSALQVAFLGGAGRDRFRDRAELLESLAVDQAAAGDPSLQNALVDVGRSAGFISRENAAAIELGLRRGFSRTWNNAPSGATATTANPDPVMYP